MSPPLSSLRVASNVIVPALLLGCVAFLSDILAIAFGFTPYISCTVLPAWQELAEPFASILTLCGLVMWVWSRLRNRIWLGLMLVGIVLGIGPWLMSYVLNPLC